MYAKPFRRLFSSVPGLTPAAVEGGQAMYGSKFWAQKHSSWFGIDEYLYHDTNSSHSKMKEYDLSPPVIQSLINEQPYQAALHLEKQLLHDQTNIFALRVAHDLHKRNGSTGHLTGSIPRVLPFWDGNLPGYRSLLALHSSSLVEASVWGSAEEAGMRALSEVAMPYPGDGPSHDVVAVNALCDLFYLCGRSREGLRFLREISIERGPDRTDVHLDPAIAVARSIFYMDVGSKDLALHQLDMALGVAPELDLDGLTRLTSAMWRAHCSFFIANNNNDHSSENENISIEIHRPMWSRLWKQWRKYGKVANEIEKKNNGEPIVRHSNLQFGPIHAALATLVYGRLTPLMVGSRNDVSSSVNYDEGGLGERQGDEEGEIGEEEEKEEDVDNDLLELWLLGDRGDVERKFEPRDVYKGLLVSSRGHQDTVAYEMLSKYEYDLNSTLGGEAIHRK